jgi:hypothetical protein
LWKIRFFFETILWASPFVRVALLSHRRKEKEYVVGITMRFQIDAIDHDDLLIRATAPDLCSVFFRGDEVYWIDFKFGIDLTYTEAEVEPFDVDQPEIDGPLAARVNVAFGEAHVMDVLFSCKDLVELHIDGAEDGKWNLEGEVIRQLYVEIVEGRPIFSVKERRLVPLAEAA